MATEVSGTTNFNGDQFVVTDTDGDVTTTDKDTGKVQYGADIQEYRQAVIDASKDGTIRHAITNGGNGREMSDAQTQQLVDLANKLPPDEITKLMASGQISQRDGSALIMLQGLSASMAPPNKQALNQAMVNFMRLSTEDQQYAIKLMSEKDLTYQVDLTDGQALEQMVAKNASTTKEQQMCAYYLATMGTDQPLNNFQDICQGNTDYGSKAAQLIYSMPDLQNMTPKEQLALEEYLTKAAEYPMKDGKIVAPDPKKSEHETLAEKLASLSIATLWYLVGQNNIKITGDSIRTKTLQHMERMNDYGDAVAAMAALSAAQDPDPDKETNLRSVFFTDHNGNEIRLTDWLDEQGIDYPVKDTWLNNHDKLLRGWLEDPDTISPEMMAKAEEGGHGWDEFEGDDLTEFKAAEMVVSDRKNKENPPDEFYTKSSRDINLNNLQMKTYGLSSSQTDSLELQMKNTSGQMRDNNQLTNNDLMRDSQLFQEYEAQYSTNTQMFTDTMMQAINGAKIRT